MRKSFKKAIAVVSAIAMVVAGTSYQPAKVSAGSSEGMTLMGESGTTAGGWTYYTGGAGGNAGIVYYAEDGDALTAYVETSSNGEWGIQIFAPVTSLTQGTRYTYTISFTADKAGSLRTKDDISGATVDNQDFVVGENEITGSFTAGATTKVLLSDFRNVSDDTTFSNIRVTYDVDTSEVITEENQGTVGAWTSLGAWQYYSTNASKIIVSGGTSWDNGVSANITKTGWVEADTQFRTPSFTADEAGTYTLTLTNTEAGDTSGSYVNVYNSDNQVIGTSENINIGGMGGSASNPVTATYTVDVDLAAGDSIYAIYVENWASGGSKEINASVALKEATSEESSSEAPSEEESSSETPSEEESSEEQGGNDPYANLTWVEVANSDGKYYVASLEDFGIQETRMNGTSVLVIPNVATGETHPIWPAFSNESFNGTSGSYSEGAGINLPIAAIVDNAYNTYTATSAVRDYEFSIILKAGTPSGEDESPSEEQSSEDQSSEEQSSEEQSSEEQSSEEESSEPEAQVPNAPTGVTYAGNDALPYYFAWGAVDGATSYNVYVNGTLADTVTGAAANLDAANFPTAGDYTIEVTAVNEAGESAKSTPYVYTVAAQTTTYAVTIDGTKVADVEEGETYTLPTDAQYGYFSGNDLYKAGATVTVNDDISLTSLNSVSVTMANGAVIKNAAPAGIAFQASVTVNGETDLVDSAFITEGMLITANDLFVELGGSELTLDSTYTFKQVTNSGWFDGTTGTYRAGITGVTEDNYIRKFIARGYAQLAYTDGTVTTVYSDMSPVRSIQQVAQAAIAAGAGNAFLEECAAAN